MFSYCWLQTVPCLSICLDVVCYLAPALTQARTESIPQQNTTEEGGLTQPPMAAWWVDVPAVWLPNWELRFEYGTGRGPARN
jgi:hypothetical protein